MAHDTHLSLRSLIEGTALVGPDRLPVAGAWIDEERLRYVGLDVGGWRDSHVALVPAERMVWDGGWRAEVTREEVEADEARLTEEAGPLDLASLPPVVTGPFGYTISPLLIAAGLMAEGREEAPPHPPGSPEGAETPRAEARRLPRVSDRLGLPVAARHDVIGRGSEAGPEVADLLIDPDGHLLSHVVIDTGEAWRAVPLHHLGEVEDGVVPLALTRDELDAMPEVVTPAEARRAKGLTPRPG
jgi:hypothetical protein